MRKIITQHCTSEQQAILDLVKDTNSAYAAKFGFEYVLDNQIRCTDRLFYWEKIAWLLSFLPTVEDGSLVVWEDVDSLNIGNESVENALPPNGVFGMVQNRHGLGGAQLSSWYNSGIIVMINTPAVRLFLQNVWNAGGRDDEDGLMAVLIQTSLTIGGIPLSSLDIKWNCWKNNAKFCADPVIKTFHGMKIEDKIAQIKIALEAKI